MSWCMAEGNLVSKANSDGGERRVHFQLRMVVGEPGNLTAVPSLSALSKNTKEIRSGGKGILIVGKSNDLLSKTEHSSCATARSLE